MPHINGSTTPCTSAQATAASTALPPDFKISAPGYDTLVTHLFVKGDPYLDSDAVFGVKHSLIADFRRNKAGEYECRYDFVLRPEGLRKAPANKKAAKKTSAPRKPAKKKK